MDGLVVWINVLNILSLEEAEGLGGTTPLEKVDIMAFNVFPSTLSP